MFPARSHSVWRTHAVSAVAYADHSSKARPLNGRDKTIDEIRYPRGFSVFSQPLAGRRLGHHARPCDTKRHGTFTTLLGMRGSQVHMLPLRPILS
jgi:hypothetical protein